MRTRIGCHSADGIRPTFPEVFGAQPSAAMRANGNSCPGDATKRANVATHQNHLIPLLELHCIHPYSADDSKDANTADLFTEISRGADKWLWFVEAHQRGAAKAAGHR